MIAYPRRSSSPQARSSPVFQEQYGLATWRQAQQHARQLATTINVVTPRPRGAPRRRSSPQCRLPRRVSTSGGEKRTAFLPAPSTSRPRLNAAVTTAVAFLAGALLRLPIAYEFDADHQPATADVTDQRMRVGQRLQAAHHMTADVGHVRDDRVLQQFDRRERRGARHGVAAERARVGAGRPRHQPRPARPRRPAAAPTQSPSRSPSCPARRRVCSIANIFPDRPIPDCTSSSHQQGCRASSSAARSRWRNSSGATT